MSVHESFGPSHEVIDRAELRIWKDVRDTRFHEQSKAIVTHFYESGTVLPIVSAETYAGLRDLYDVGKKSHTPPAFTFIDLFAGIGGFRLALEKFAGKSVFAVEWEKSAQETYYENYGEYPFGDINLFTGDGYKDKEIRGLIPDHDILAAGFPCQPFSLGGVSARNSLNQLHGFDCETQGTLFYSIARIAELKKPKVLFLENVKNILHHDGGMTFEVIKSTIEGLGYTFFHKLIGSQTLVPQKRVRCFMVCVRNDLVGAKGDFTFPEFEGESLALRSILEEDPDPVYTISDKLWEGHQKRTERNVARGTGFTAHLADLDKPSKTIVARYGKDGKECLIPQEGKNPRKLTIGECRRLFGYPKDFKLPEAMTPVYKLFGNSVVVPVVERISGRIIEQYFSD